MDKEQYLSFIKDTSKTLNWIAENIENPENATILITWINKMADKFNDNFMALETLKNNEEN